ncbi:unnamed protein product, partial [Closterium sp. NIES-54]
PTLGPPSTPIPALGPATAATATATSATASATAATATAAAAIATTAAPAYNTAMALLRVLAFDPEGRLVQFDTWLDNLQLYLLSDSKDSVSLFDLASGATTAPPATADTHALYDAVVARYSSPATAALGRLLLPYLFPELSAFSIVDDLVSHLRASDARYRAAVLAEFLDRNQPPMFITLYFIVTRLPDSLLSVRDHFLSLDPTSLSVDLIEQHLLAVETSAVAVGAARGTLRPPFFEGCSPSPLAPSYASAAAADVSAAEDIRASSTSAKCRSSKSKGGRGGGGGKGSSVGGGSGGGGGGGTGAGSGGSGGGGGGSGGSGGSGGGGNGGGGTGAWRVGSGGGQRQQQQRRSETPSPQQLRERFLRGASGGSCPIAIFDLDFDAILSAMYALSVSAEGDCYRCVPPDPGIAAAALGASESGTLPGTAPAEALHTFTLDSCASCCFFRDSTTLSPLPAPVPVRLADPSGGPVVARSSIVLPCPAVPSGSLSGLHLPSFSTNLVSTTALQDAMVTTTTPRGQRASICTCTRTGRHLATFTRRPGSSLYTLATEPSQVAASAQVSASGQVAASCSCRLLSHQTLLWHHRLGHPSLPRLRGMHSLFLFSGLPRSLRSLPPLPAPPCLPCIEGRQRAAPHSSSFPPTSAPLQTLHMDVVTEFQDNPALEQHVTAVERTENETRSTGGQVGLYHPPFEKCGLPGSSLQEGAMMDGELKRPASEGETKEWDRQSKDGFFLLSQCLSSNQLHHVKHLIKDIQCGPKAWKILKDVHAPSSEAMVVVLERQLHAVKINEGDAVQGAFDQLRDLYMKLSAAGVDYPEKIKCYKALSLLPESWGPLVLNLNGMKDSWSLEWIRAQVLQDEFRRKELTAAAGEGGGSAYDMKGFKGRGSKKGKAKEGSGGEQYSGGKRSNKGGKRCGGKCWYCHVEGHPWFKCRKLPDGWRPGQPSIEGSKGVHGAMGESMGCEEGDGGAGGHGGMFYHVGEAWLKRVLLVPGLCANLLSTKALSEAGMKMEMMGTKVFKATLDGRVLWDLRGGKDMHRSMWEIPVLPWKEAAARLAAEAVRGGHASHVTSGGGGDGSDGGLLVHGVGATIRFAFGLLSVPPVLAVDAEGRPMKFDTWLDDLHLFLQLTAKEDISLYDHALGHATAPAATSDSTARSQWQTRDAHARFAIRNSLPIDEREHFGQHKTAQALTGGGGGFSCTYVIRTVDRTGQPCGGPHATQRCFARLNDAWRVQFPQATELPRWVDLLKKGIDIYALDFDAILTAMYVMSTSGEGAEYLCVPHDPGIRTSASAAPGTRVSATPGAGEAAALGACASAPPGTESTAALHTFTLDSGASRCFFRDRTALEPLARSVAVSLTDPSGGPVIATSSTVLPCPAVPSGTLSGLHLPSFSTNLVAGCALQDGGVHQFTPAYERVTHCTCARMGRHLATFTRLPGSDLYTLTTGSPQVAASASVSASGQLSAPCSCRSLAHETVLWHHRLGHPSVQRLRAMHSRYLVSGLPRVLPPLPPSPAPPCLPCVEGRQRAAPHSSSFPPTTAPLQTLHMDVWGPARVRGQGQERYFPIVVDDYSRYTTVFPLRTKGEVPDVLIPWIRRARLQLSERFHSDFPVLRLHSDRGGEFSSDLLVAYCAEHGIEQSFTLPASPQQNGVAERRIGLVMEVARTSLIHAAAPHFLWPFAVRYAAHQLNLWPRVSLPETSPTLLWTGEVSDATRFRVWGSRAFVRDTSADKLSSRAVPCVFLGFVPDALGWQFYHATSRRVLPSQDVTFDESVPYYHLFPYRTAPLPPPPLFLVPGAAVVDPLPPQGAAPSGVSQVDPVELVEVAVDSRPAAGAEPGGAEHGGAEPGGAEPGGAEPGGTEPGGAEPRSPDPLLGAAA